MNDQTVNLSLSTVQTQLILIRPYEMDYIPLSTNPSPQVPKPTTEYRTFFISAFQMLTSNFNSYLIRTVYMIV